MGYGWSHQDGVGGHYRVLNLEMPQGIKFDRKIMEL